MPPPPTTPAKSSVANRNPICDWLGALRRGPAACLVWKSSSRLPRSFSLSGSGAVKTVSQKSQKTAQNRPSARSKARGPYGRPFWVSRKTDCHKSLIFKWKNTVAHYVARDSPDGVRSCGESLLGGDLLGVGLSPVRRSRTLGEMPVAALAMRRAEGAL